MSKTEKNKKYVKEHEAKYKDNPFMYACTKQVFLENFSINYKGDVFFCCQDYYQTSIVGNITKNSIHTIMNSPEANNLRDQMYGKIPADKDLLCRKCSYSVIDFFDF